MRRSPARSFGDALCLAVAFGSSAAHAEQAHPPLVVIVDAEPGESSITRRLRQEIEALGFSVEVRAEAEPGLGTAVAVIEVKPARPGSVELAIVDPETARVVRRALTIEALHDPNASELVATRTVELLRASRLLVAARAKPEPSTAAQSPAPPEQDHPAPKPEPPEVAQPPSRWLLGVGLGVAYSAGWALGSDLVLGSALRISRPFALLAELSLPLSPCQLATDNGNIDAFSNRYRVGGLVDAVPESAVGFQLAGGVELEQLSFRGRASPPYVNAESDLWAFAPWLKVSGSVRVVPSLRAVAALTGAWTVPRTGVNFAGREVSVWGRPAVTAAFGAEWSLP
jgi:hypothetical protein